MGVSAGTRTISDGLVLALDAANTRSYPGSGTTWFDLSDRGNNGTLTNGPSFVRPTFREPFGGAGSVYFDGSGDYMTTTYTTTAFDWYTTNIDFTIECWFYANSLSGTSYSGGPGIDHPTLVGNRDAASVSDYWSFGPTSDGKVAFYYFKGTETMVKSSTSITANSWNHIAMTKTSLGITLFVNGLSQTANAIVGTPQSGGGLPLTIGQGNGTAFNGYISNLRITRGTALYTQNFTPKRESFVTQSSPYTSLLTCQNGTIRDASPNNFTITRVGNVTPVFYAPYISFDGTNDYVSHQNVSDFNFGNGNFSIESFVYLTNYSSNYSGFYGAIVAGKDSNPTREYSFVIFGNSSSYSSIGFFLNPGSGNLTESISQSFTFNLNTWYYVAVSRNGNTLSLFVDGYVIKSQNTTSTISSTSVPLRIGSGGYAGYEYFFPGYISTVKVYKGKGLTAAEVSQNYQNTKSRYGL